MYIGGSDVVAMVMVARGANLGHRNEWKSCE